MKTMNKKRHKVIDAYEMTPEEVDNYIQKIDQSIEQIAMQHEYIEDELPGLKRSANTAIAIGASGLAVTSAIIVAVVATGGVISPLVAAPLLFFLFALCLGRYVATEGIWQVRVHDIACEQIKSQYEQEKESLLCR